MGPAYKTAGVGSMSGVDASRHYIRVSPVSTSRKADGGWTAGYSEGIGSAEWQSSDREMNKTPSSTPRKYRTSLSIFVAFGG